MVLLQRMLVFFWVTAAAACTTVGPHPQVLTGEAEIKATKKVERILVAPTTGTGTTDADAMLTKAVPASAYSRYKDNMILASGLDGPLETLHMPVAVLPLLTINWQTAFYHWLQDDKTSAEDGAEMPTTITRSKVDLYLDPPKTAGKVPKSPPDEKRLAQLLEKKKSTYTTLGKQTASGNVTDLIDTAATNAQDLKAVESLLRDLGQRLQITYVLVSHLEGNQASFDKNNPVTLHVALVNIKTGKFRYYARSIGRKKDLNADFPNFVAVMARNMFEDLEEQDKIK